MKSKIIRGTGLRMNSILNSLSEAKDTLDKVINDKDLIQKINQSVEVLTLAFKNNKKL
ncbi:MAG: hypothetical protein H6622_11465 [Halobacteriovoraceae bacterium]|nr:hypothetical protein [Halobacteriovoraceae bacterium]